MLVRLAGVYCCLQSPEKEIMENCQDELSARHHKEVSKGEIDILDKRLKTAAERSCVRKEVKGTEMHFLCSSHEKQE